MTITRAAAFHGLMFLALGAFASRTALGQAGTAGQSTPQTTQPSGQTGNMQQSAPSNAPTGRSEDRANPAAQPDAQGQTNQAPQTQNGAQMPGMDAQVHALAQELNLNADQQTKVRTILEDQHGQAMTIIQNDGMPRADKVQKIHALRATTISRVRDVLTAEQKPKFDQMVSDQDERMRQRQQMQAPPSQQPPSGGSNPPPPVSDRKN